MLQGTTARESAQLLLEHGADIEANAITNLTPLHFAAWNNSTRVCTTITRTCADIEAKDITNRTPLHFCTMNVVQKLTQSRESHTSSLCCTAQQPGVCKTVTRKWCRH